LLSNGRIRAPMRYNKHGVKDEANYEKGEKESCLMFSLLFKAVGCLAVWVDAGDGERRSEKGEELEMWECVGACGRGCCVLRNWHRESVGLVGMTGEC